ncbi:probable C-terminal domain small phosphatase [Zingiber officinale]|uniref:probable C-terminal domain small phosphatase n=1 Tax=Zingiber officinale TaxID=94328 RepID=UPI001C4B6703|nr:probable C-terminal domain small phosphatase [Zingiber officinale]
MVSKFATRASSCRSRSPVGHHAAGGKKITPRSSPSPIKAAIARSVRSCRRRLTKLFSRIAILGGVSSSPQNHGFLRLGSTPTKPLLHPTPMATAAAKATAELPPPSFPEKKTVFLDLDETLVQSRTDPPPDRYDFTVHPSIDGRVVPFYVLKRPGADELLRAAAGDFEVVVFTAGLREYASLVLDRLDPAGNLIAHRLYRDSCREMEGKLVKDLARVGRALDRAVLVDDNPNAYVLQPENALRVTPFSDDLCDRELSKVIKFFEVAALFEDMRDAVAYYRSELGDHKPKPVCLLP